MDFQPVCIYGLFVRVFSDLDSHLPSRDDVGDDVFRRRVRVDPVRPLADGDHIAALLNTKTKKLFNNFSDFFWCWGKQTWIYFTRK
jgi:hypothetical protein